MPSLPRNLKIYKFIFHVSCFEFKFRLNSELRASGFKTLIFITSAQTCFHSARKTLEDALDLKNKKKFMNPKHVLLTRKIKTAFIWRVGHCTSFGFKTLIFCISVHKCFILRVRHRTRTGFKTLIFNSSAQQSPSFCVLDTVCALRSYTLIFSVSSI